MPSLAMRSATRTPTHGSRTLTLNATDAHHHNGDDGESSDGVLRLRGHRSGRHIDRNARGNNRSSPVSATDNSDAVSNDDMHPSERPRVTWADDTVDNEGLGRKKSKICCIYHKPRAFDESESESNDESDSSASSNGSGSSDSDNSSEVDSSSDGDSHSHRPTENNNQTKCTEKQRRRRSRPCCHHQHDTHDGDHNRIDSSARRQDRATCRPHARRKHGSHTYTKTIAPSHSQARYSNGNAYERGVA